ECRGRGRLLEGGRRHRRGPRQRGRILEADEGAAESEVAAGRIVLPERVRAPEGRRDRAHPPGTWHHREQQDRRTRERDTMTHLSFGTVAPTSRRAVAYIIDALIAAGIGIVLS